MRSIQRQYTAVSECHVHQTILVWHASLVDASVGRGCCHCVMLLWRKKLCDAAANVCGSRTGCFLDRCQPEASIARPPGLSMCGCTFCSAFVQLLKVAFGVGVGRPLGAMESCATGGLATLESVLSYDDIHFGLPTHCASLHTISKSSNATMHAGRHAGLSGDGKPQPLQSLLSPLDHMTYRRIASRSSAKAVRAQLENRAPVVACV